VQLQEEGTAFSGEMEGVVMYSSAKKSNDAGPEMVFFVRKRSIPPTLREKVLKRKGGGSRP